MHDRFNGMSEVFFGLCKFANTPFSLGAWMLFKSGDHSSLLDYVASWHPRRYSERDVDILRKDYCVKSFLSKWKGLDTGINTKDVAIQAFAKSETICRQTNRSFKHHAIRGFDSRVECVLHAARRKIADVLGPMSLFKIEPFVEWGPGATFDLRRKEAQVDKKIAQTPWTVSRRAFDLLEGMITRDLHWSYCVLGLFPDGPYSLMRSLVSITETCRVVTVPKSAKTDRTIAIEPTLNLYGQKGVGGYIRSRLKRFGVDLDNQKINQRGAERAFKEGLATLDLSAASDSVCKEIVFDLLPIDWAVLLDDLRSHQALMPDGSCVRLEKFSSMGNGFTFELESLIFWAVSASVSELYDGAKSPMVYGDDIIVSKECAPELVEVLSVIGFSTNVEKSFIDGLFFESCGKHYFGGFDVTPCYQKELLDSLQELVRCHNRLARWGSVYSTNCAVHVPLRRIAISRGNRYLPEIPFGDEGDDGFLTDFSEIEHLLRFDRNRGWRFKILAQRPRVIPGIAEALLSRRMRLDSSRQAVLPIFKEASSGKTLYGDDLELPPERGVAATFSWRWIIPASVCPR